MISGEDQGIKFRFVTLQYDFGLLTLKVVVYNKS